MIAWTVATPDMMEMAEEAASRIDQHGNMQTIILPAKTREECHKMKVEAWLEFGWFAWFFDADFWVISPISKLPDGGECIIGAPNNTPNLDKYPSMPTDHLICTGFWGMNPSIQVNKDVILTALEYQGERPLEDERFINQAAFFHKATVARLSTLWNWCGEFPPKNVMAIHAAGRGDKLNWLREVTKQYERTHLDK